MRSLPPVSLFRGVTVLVVEDHPDSRDVLQKILHAVGIRVVLARDGREALGRLATECPRLILCDLRMPGMDGFAFLNHLRLDPTHRRVPVIAVTAFGTEADLDRTWKAGFDGHLTKPIDFDSLVSLLTRVLSTQAPPELDEPEEA